VGASCRWFLVAAVLAAGCAAGGGSSGSDMSVCPATDATGCGACWTRLSQTTLSASETSVDFGKQAIGSATDRTITVTNGGDVDSGRVSGTVWDPPFSFKGATDTGSGANYPGTGGTCNTPLSPGQSCTLVLTFDPIGDPGMTFASTLVVEWYRGSFCDNGGGGGPSPPELRIALAGSD
jgi:hypothetical protein